MYTPQEAARAWIRALGVYDALGGKDPYFGKSVWGYALRVGIPEVEIIRIHQGGRKERPTKYLLGWVGGYPYPPAKTIAQGSPRIRAWVC
jgi:hypothetical protein